MVGPALPANFYSHCAVKSGDTIVLGGGTEVPSTFFLFDWESEVWTQMPDIPMGRNGHGCAIIDTANSKELWVIGGHGNTKTNVDSVYVFNFGSGHWSTGTPLPYGMSGFSTEVVDNNVFIIGGYRGSDQVATILQWNPAVANWEEHERGLDQPRAYFASTLVDERSGIICT